MKMCLCLCTWTGVSKRQELRKGQWDREMEKRKPTGQQYYDLVIDESNSSREKKRYREGEGGVLRRERKGGIIGCEVMGLDLGFRKVQRKK